MITLIELVVYMVPFIIQVYAILIGNRIDRLPRKIIGLLSLICIIIGILAIIAQYEKPPMLDRRTLSHISRMFLFAGCSLWSAYQIWGLFIRVRVVPKNNGNGNI